MDYRVRAAIRYSEDRVRDNVRLDEAAAHVSLSPSHFHRLFRREVGESFYAYIKRVRMNYAAARLKRTSDSVLEIATAFGYSSNAAFSRAFASYGGHPPVRYRRDRTGWSPLAAGHSGNRTPTIRNLDAFWCLARRYYGHYGMVHRHWHDFMGRLPAELARSDRKPLFAGLVHDDPCIVFPGWMRYDCCCIVTDPGDWRRIPDAQSSFEVLQTRPGRYVALEHRGASRSRGTSYGLILDEWLPATNQVIADDPAIEIFHSPPAKLSSQGPRFEIFIPLF